MSAISAVALAAASVVLLTGCAFGPDPAEVYERTAGVFDELTAELSAVEPAVLRTVEMVPTDALACDGDADETQQALVARGVLSVRATDGASADVVNTLAASLDGDEWEPARSDIADVRAFSNEQGITVALTDADPVVVVSVFGPCLPPVDMAADG